MACSFDDRIWISFSSHYHRVHFTFVLVLQGAREPGCFTQNNWVVNKPTDAGDLGRTHVNNWGWNVDRNLDGGKVGYSDDAIPRK